MESVSPGVALFDYSAAYFAISHAVHFGRYEQAC